MTNADHSIMPIKNLNSTKLWIGLTKREYFAAMAMQGLAAQGVWTYEQTAQHSIKHADALISELNKT